MRLALMTWDVLLGYATGLRLFAPDIEGMTLLRTLLVVHTCQALVCRALARHHGYSPNFWTAAGLLTGIWAVALLMLLPPKTARPR